MTAYVRGQRVPGECDRCGMEVLLRTMKSETVRGARKSNLVCQDCWDLDHPQNFQGKVKVIDPQSVRNPRPPRVQIIIARRRVTEDGNARVTENGDSRKTED